MDDLKISAAQAGDRGTDRGVAMVIDTQSWTTDNRSSGAPSADIVHLVSPWDAFWKWAQSPLGETIVGGLAVALIVFVVVRLRKPIFGGMARFFHWTATIRVTTTARQKLMIEEARRSQGSLLDGLNAQLEIAVRAKPAAEAAAAPRSPSKPPPRWSIQRKKKDDSSQFVLLNNEPESFATNIRLDAPPELFDFFDSARWDELEPYAGDAFSHGQFRGKMKGKAHREGVMFSVRWLDEAGIERTAQAHLDRPPARPIVF